MAGRAWTLRHATSVNSDALHAEGPGTGRQITDRDDEVVHGIRIA